MRGLLVAASAQDRSHDRSNGASLTSRPGRDVRGIGSQTFADAVGDSPYAPDIGAINIANDDAGNVTLKIEMWPFMYLYSSDTIAMFFDTDLNLATGSSIGAEYALLIDGWDNTYALSRWTGSTWDFSTPQSTFSSSYYFGSTIVFNRTDLGSTSAFGLNIVTSWRSTYST